MFNSLYANFLLDLYLKILYNKILYNEDSQTWTPRGN
jgi:hypothetical protein